MNIDQQRFDSSDGRRVSLPRRIVSILIGSIAVAAGVTTILLLQLRSDAVDSGKKLLTALVHLSDEQTSRTLQNVEQAVLTVSAILAAAPAPSSPAPADVASIDATLRKLVEERPYLSVIRVLDETGRGLYASDTGFAGLDLSDRDYFRQHRDRPELGFQFGSPIRNRVEGRWVIPATQTLRKPNGDFGGVIVAGVDLAFFDRVWAVEKELPRLSVALFHSGGVLLMRSPLDERLIGKAFPNAGVFEQLRLHDAGVFETKSVFDGEGRLFAFRRLTAYPDMVLVVGQAMDQVLAAWWRVTRIVLFGLVVGAIVVGALATRLIREWRGSRTAQDRYRLMFDASPYPMFLLERETSRFLAVNQGTIEQYGWSRAEFLAMTGLDVILPQEGPQPQPDAPGEAQRRPGDALLIQRHRRKDGTVIDVEVALRSMTFEGRRAVLGLAHDITERIAAERAQQTAESELQHSQERYRLLFDANPYAVVVSDLETQRFVAANDTAATLYGYTREEFLGLTLNDIVVPEDLTGALAKRREFADKAGPYALQVRNRRKDGSVFDIELVARGIRYDGRSAILTIIADVSERVAAERAQQAAETELQHSQDRYRMLFDANPHSVTVSDFETQRFVAVNDAAVAQYGWSRAEFLRLTVHDIVTPEDLPGMLEKRREFMGRTGPFSLELRSRRKDGTVFDVEVASRSIRYDGRPAILTIAMDVSERAAAERARLEVEDQLRQAQKMEAVGQLTGGIAHDFNNILMVILANVEALEDEAALEKPFAELLSEIGSATQRAADLTRQLLAFSRKQALRPQSTNINDLVTATGRLLRRTLGEHIEVDSILADGLWSVDVDRAQLESALVNLSINARDAMPKGGRLLIETANVMLDADYAARNPDAAPGDFVMLAVSDTGCGMPPEILSKVFEPFFTTKGVGKGTGLGLSMVYGFIKQSKGHITIYSEVGQGTSIKLYLPRNDAARSDVAVAQQAAMPRGHERILIVEDDPHVRAGVVRHARDLGYDVTEAPDGRAGLAAFEAALLPFDLLLTDVIMPGPMNGPALAAEVARRWPATRLVFMSGYTENAIGQHGRLDPDVLLLSKPFRKGDLALILRQALDRAGATAR